MPAISNIVPAQNDPLAAAQALRFDVVDDIDPTVLVVIIARYGAGQAEVVYNGSVFGLNYPPATNTKTAVAGGFRYQILRDIGWPATPVAIDVRAVGSSGNVLSSTLSWSATPLDPTAIESVTVLSAVGLRIGFNRAILSDAEFQNRCNYMIHGLGGTPDLTVLGMIPYDTTHVDLVVAEMRNAGTYQARVANLRDTFGRYIEPGYNFFNFNGVGFGPTTSLTFPSPGAVGVARNASMTFDVIDLHSGVDLSSIAIKVNNVTAYQAEAFTPGFDGPGSRVDLIDNGFRIVVDPATDFPFGQLVTAEITGKDFAGNPLSTNPQGGAGDFPVAACIIARDIQGTVTTSDLLGQTRTLATYPVLPGKVIGLTSRVVGVGQDTAGKGWFIATAFFQRVNGALSQVGDTSYADIRRTNNDLETSFVISGNNVLLSVKGSAAQTYSWSGSLGVIESC